jgi:hypothetical protein
LRNQLQTRFGELPPAISARLDAAADTDLERWGVRLLEISSRVVDRA